MRPLVLPAAVQVSLLNFFITPAGLEEQLLGKLVAKERKDLEDEKKHLLQSNANMLRELKELQEAILRMLQEAEGVCRMAAGQRRCWWAGRL